MAAAKRVLRYLCSTSGMGLVLGGRRPVVLTGHADASWADDQATQRSSQGYTFSLGSGSVSWRSTRSSSVLSSSCEAEIYAGVMAAQELRWLTYLLTDLGEQPRSPPVLPAGAATALAAAATALAAAATAPAAAAPAPSTAATALLLQLQPLLLLLQPLLLPLQPLLLPLQPLLVQLQPLLLPLQPLLLLQHALLLLPLLHALLLLLSAAPYCNCCYLLQLSLLAAATYRCCSLLPLLMQILLLLLLCAFSYVLLLLLLAAAVAPSCCCSLLPLLLATAAAGGGAAGSAAGAGGDGGATGSAGGAGPTTDRHCLSWPLSRQLQQLGVDSGGHCLSWTTPPLSSFASGRQQSQQETFSPQVLSELFPQRCVTGSVEAAALGAIEYATALGANESAAALGARASSATGPSSAEALHTFTLDSGASRCSFRDCTSLTPLAAPVPRAAICTCSRTGLHLATFTRRLGSSLYTLTIASAQVAAAGHVAALSQVSASGQLAASCSCRVLSHQTLLWHHRLGHPSLPRLRGMHSHLLVSGLPRSVPSLPRSPAPPCRPCIEGQQRAAPHSSEFPPTTAPLQTLHMYVWGPAPVDGTDKERYFLLVVDDYTRYTTVFPLRHKAEVSGVLIPWIRATRRQLRERFSQDFPVLRLHSDRGGEFSSDLLAEFCLDEGIVARTSMVHAAAPHFLWSFAVRYDAHQLNFWPRVSEPKTLPTLRWTGKVGDASVFWVWGALSLVRDAKANKLSSRTLRCVFLGFPTDAPPWHFYHPRSRSCSLRGVTLPLTTRRPLAALYAWRPPPGFPPWPSLPPPQPGAMESGAETAGAESGGAETESEGSGGAGSGGAGSWSVVTGGAGSGGPASPSGGGAVGDPAGGPRAGQPPQPDLLETLSPQAICAWIVRQGSPGGGGYGPAGAGAASLGGTVGAGGTGGNAGAGGTGGTAGAGGAASAGGTRGAAGAGGAVATSSRGATGAAGAGPTSPRGTASAGGAGGTAGARGAGAGGTGGAGSAGPGDARSGGAGATGAGGAVRAGGPTGAANSGGTGGVAGAGAARAGGTAGAGGAGGAIGAVGTGGARGTTSARGPRAAGASGAVGAGGAGGAAGPAGAEGAGAAGAGGAGAAETRASTPVRAHRVACPCPPAAPGTHGMALRPSSVPQRVVLPEPPASSLPHVSDPESDLARAARPTFTRLLATVVTDPDLESTAAFALVTELVDLAARSRLNYVASLVTESESVCPPSVGGELALGSDVLEDKQFELDCLAATLPRFASMLLCPEGDPDAPDIPTPRSYAEAIAGTYVDEVPPPGANIVDGMWIFRVKRPSGSPPAFKVRYVARGFSQQQGVDFFQTFSPTPKMTTLRVLLHVAAQRDYELHSLDFSTAFLQGSLHKEIWLRRPPDFTGSFPVGTQWSLRRLVYGLRQAPREWHDTH
ncbi:unnamed protein product [Closterium sp. NIES-54]